MVSVELALEIVVENIEQGRLELGKVGRETDNVGSPFTKTTFSIEDFLVFGLGKYLYINLYMCQYLYAFDS